MKHRLRQIARSAALVLVGLTIPAGWALAQPAVGGGTAPAAPQGIAVQAYTDPTGRLEDIKEFIRKNLDVLSNDGEPAAQAKSRENLVQACFQSGQPAQPAFLGEYCAVLDKEFGTRLKAKPSLRTRLNFAIVTAKVATIAKNSVLAPTTQKLVADGSEPVVLWGLKAAQPIVPELLKIKLLPGTKMHPLVEEIGKAVRAHPSGPIFDEGYEALGSVAENPAPVDVRAPVIDELMILWENRLQQYRKDVPEDPAVDGKPVRFLTTQAMWNTILQNQASRTRVMQLISDQLSMAAQWADHPKGQARRDQLILLTARCGSACDAIGQHQNIPKLKTEADIVWRMSPLTTGSSAKLVALTDPLVKAIATSFPNINPPPAVGAAAAAAGTNP